MVFRVAEVVRGHGGPVPKSLDWDKNFKPEQTLFCLKLIFVTIYAHFGDLWAKKSAIFGQKQCFWGKKCTITWYILHISYFIFHISYFIFHIAYFIFFWIRGSQKGWVGGWGGPTFGKNSQIISFFF